MLKHPFQLRIILLLKLANCSKIKLPKEVHKNMTNVFATATEMQNNFGRYLNMVINGSEILITKNGRVVAQVIPKGASEAPITDSLRGVLKGAPDLETVKDAYMRQKHGMDD